MAEPDPMVQLEAAIMVRLGAGAQDVSTDPELALLLPGGVHSRYAGGETFPYLNLGLVRQDDDYTFGKVWRHRFRYQFTVTDATGAVDAASAALERVNNLMQDVSAADLPMEDYEIFFARRAGRVNPPQPVSSGVTYTRLADEYRLEVIPK